ncbi:hypothetical protein [Campylobacter vulpis]|uniref:hypothetical protein n=1 Tax=Campylobacter vulpis TaxID=1655500 RepID=UPI001BCC6937|nr:hypothetical protein [Campylobacter vulpis]MBS4236106.1 hypothetical protein [Campylobacter vulpis]MBS4269664.1 hypothetical protein [Campylobacter vulpis]
MKKAYVLLGVVFLTLFVGFSISVGLNISSYTPRFLKDSYAYTQAKILRTNTKELAKYALFQAKKEGFECLNSISFSYPNVKDKIKFEYFYAFAECQNGRLININSDANLSKDGVIIVNISVFSKLNEGVNEENFINEKLRLVAKENFWTP